MKIPLPPSSVGPCALDAQILPFSVESTTATEITLRALAGSKTRPPWFPGATKAKEYGFSYDQASKS